MEWLDSPDSWGGIAQSEIAEVAEIAGVVRSLIIISLLMETFTR